MAHEVGIVGPPLHEESETMIVCGTGHRPDKLGGYSKSVFEDLVSLASWWLVRNEIGHVISGMALGWDQALAVAAIRHGIPVAAYIPFEGQESRWPEASQTYYRKILKKCHRIHIVCSGGYSAAAMQTRNERMVDDSDVVLALWDGSSGGTGNCVRYAVRKKARIVNLWDVYTLV